MLLICFYGILHEGGPYFKVFIAVDSFDSKAYCLLSIQVERGLMLPGYASQSLKRGGSRRE
jgi:hypothetical protein